MNKDVFSVLTPAGKSALAVVGFSGPSVWSKLSPYFVPQGKKKPSFTTSDALHLGRLQKDDLGDQVVLSLSGSEKKQRVELQMHGGPAVLEWVHSLAVSLEMETVDWQQWLKLHNSSVTGDAEVALTQARTAKAAAILLDQFWSLEKELTSIGQAMAKPDERTTCQKRIDNLLEWAPLGEHLTSPWKVVLAGPVNAGKSTLLNALVGFDRSITSSKPGTTRDAVQSVTSIDGYLFEFWDTAGLRETSDKLEVAGMERTQSHLQDADLILWVNDASQADADLPQGIAPEKLLRVSSKSDLPSTATHRTDVSLVSAKTGDGVAELLQRVKRRLVPKDPTPGQLMPFRPAQSAQLRTWAETLATSGTIKIESSPIAMAKPSGSGRMSA